MQTSLPTKSRRNAVPRTGQHAEEIQAFGTVVAMPIGLGEQTRRESVDNLNQILADTMTLRDLYKKHHWQVSGPTFYQLHLLFDKHFGEQSELVDQIAERIMMLGGVSVAMAADVAEATQIPRPPKGREEVPVQISRLLEAHEIVLVEARKMARQCGRGRRRRHERPAGQQRDSHERVAGLVRRRARGRYPAGTTSRFGPWTPRIRIFSMSAVRLGPVMSTISPRESLRRADLRNRPPGGGQMLGKLIHAGDDNAGRRQVAHQPLRGPSNNARRTSRCRPARRRP